MSAQATASAQAKAALRKQMRAWRRSLGDDVCSAAANSAASVLAASSQWAAAHHIALYLPNDGEMDTAPLIGAARRERRTLYLPRVRPRGARCLPRPYALERSRFCEWLMAVKP